MSDETVEIEVVIEHNTGKAILVDDGDRVTWLPLSECPFEWKDEIKGIATVTVPVWMAKQKGLI
jgi:hypothetical protein